eukprot:maker-scaffold619_size123246-snap-gene-0.40 protein:Tk05507 transcript:maker-scaffold619_size123246-snap-gene-0.40-mRNA-1 annotation:"osteopetrosis-associated transmembrane protein 1"
MIRDRMRSIWVVLGLLAWASAQGTTPNELPWAGPTTPLMPKTPPTSQPRSPALSDADDDPDHWCTQRLLAFGQAVANFKLCLTGYARPVGICLNCQMQKATVARTYQALNETWGPTPAPTPDQPGPGLTCYQSLINQDRLQVVASSYDEVLGPNSLWSRGHCESCYETTDSFTNISNLTADFLFKFTDVEQCFNSYDAHWEDHPTNMICTICSEVYQDAVKFYKDNYYPKTRTSTFIYQICIDLQDKWNHTVRAWSYQYKCSNNYIVELMFYLLSMGAVIPLALACLKSFVFPYCGYSCWLDRWHTDFHDYGWSYETFGQLECDEESENELDVAVPQSDADRD